MWVNTPKCYATVGIGGEYFLLNLCNPPLTLSKGHVPATTTGEK